MLVTPKKGADVLCNGYRGTITEVCEWSRHGSSVMCNVRLESGTVCVSNSDLFPWQSTECPACSGPSVSAADIGAALFRCTRCNAIHGRIDEGNPFPLLSGKWEPVEVANACTAPRYFDYCVMRGMILLNRWHGWFNPSTGNFIQIG